jgi:hypothetical protein
MNELNQALLNQAIPIIATLFGTVLTILSGYLVAYINTKVKNAKLNQALQLVQETGYNVVMGLEQTLVSKFIQVNADGKLTEEEKVLLKQTALQSIHDQLKPEVKKALEFGYANLDEYLDKLIESLVHTTTKE